MSFGPEVVIRCNNQYVSAYVRFWIVSQAAKSLGKIFDVKRIYYAGSLKQAVKGNFGRLEIDVSIMQKDYKFGLTLDLKNLLKVSCMPIVLCCACWCQFVTYAGNHGFGRGECCQEGCKRNVPPLMSSRTAPSTPALSLQCKGNSRSQK